MYIELQYKSIKKFIKNFTFIVVNDAVGESQTDKVRIDLSVNFDKINEICKKLNIKCIEFDYEHHLNSDCKEKDCTPNPGSRHYDVINLISNHCVNNYDNGYLMILDSDMFFLQEFNVKNYMNKYHISSILNSLTDIHHKPYNLEGDLNNYYMWPNLFLINLEYKKYLKEMNWKGGYIEINGKTYAGDVGACTCEFVKKHIEKIKIIQVEETSKIDNKLHDLHVDFEKNGLFKYRQLLLENSIIHLLRGTNWDSRPENDMETQINILSAFFEKNIL